jgi:hypothetical protein
MLMIAFEALLAMCFFWSGVSLFLFFLAEVPFGWELV